MVNEDVTKNQVDTARLFVLQSAYPVFGLCHDVKPAAYCSNQAETNTDGALLQYAH